VQASSSNQISISEIAKEMRLEDSKSEELGLSPEEYAFYSVLSENKSTRFLDAYLIV
jgi:type I restriction enzyme R subunit